MIAIELIDANIPVLNMHDNIARASSIMDAQDVHQLPVLEDGVFKGFLEEEILYSAVSESAIIGDYPLKVTNCTAYADQHFYEVVKIISTCEHGMLAVLDREEKYIGTITYSELFRAFANTYGVQTSGSIIVLSLKQIDYTLSEITRLVESENAKVIACQLETVRGDSNHIEVTLKLDKTNVSHIVSTLNRFNYHVVGLYQEEVVVSYEKERLDALMRYLDM